MAKACLCRVPALLGVSLMLGLLGCTQEPRQMPPPDCSVENDYEFYPLFLQGEATMPELDFWYAAGDLHADLPETPAYNSIDNFAGSICEHTEGKVFTAGQNHDWGSVGGRYQPLGDQDGDASAYEGLSFWGLSLYDHSTEITLSDITSSTVPAPPQCIPEEDAEGNGNPGYTDENGVPVANGCGSAFSRQLVMAKYWKFYTLPFTDFFQTTRDPRFKPGGLDTSAIRLFSFRVPKGTFIENSFVHIAWYRKAPE